MSAIVPKRHLYKTLQAHWRSFLADLESDGDSSALPAFVVSEVEAFLRCGNLAHGFVLAKCRECGWSRAVAFSCRRRGFCPSCIGRRMCDFAAALADRVIPRVPMRQWVLTVTRGLRGKIAYDPGLTTVVLRHLIAAVSGWLRGRARRLGIRGPIKTGAVTIIQRFNSALDVSPHFHVLFMDGVYSFPVGRKPVFHPTPAPRDEDVAHVAAAVFRRVERKLPDREPSAGQRRFVESAPLLVAMADASARGVVATGPRRGCRIVRVRGPSANVDAVVMGRQWAQVEGYNLQAVSSFDHVPGSRSEVLVLFRADDHRSQHGLSLGLLWRGGCRRGRQPGHDLRVVGVENSEFPARATPGAAAVLSARARGIGSSRLNPAGAEMVSGSASEKRKATP